MDIETLQKFSARVMRSWWLYLFGLIAAVMLIEVMLSIHVVKPGEALVVVNKWGPEPAWKSGGLSAAITADKPGGRGIQRDTLGEGFHFLLPFIYETFKIKQVVIGKEEIGIKIRMFGDPLPAGRTLATEKDNYKGVIDKVLVQGRHLINLKAYRVLIRKKTEVPAGHVGVQIQLFGDTTFGSSDYVLEEKETRLRGVQTRVLTAGTWPVNPFAYKVIPLDVRSNLLNMADKDEIRFPSNDGFIISLRGAVRWRIVRNEAAQAYVKFIDTSSGARDAIEHKLILPMARAFCRIKGSQFDAAQLIHGETRIEFENEFEEVLRSRCRKYHIEIEDATITGIETPAAIASIIQQRSTLVEEYSRIKASIQKEVVQVGFSRQKALQTRERDLKEVEGEMEALMTAASQKVAVDKINANQKLQVAIQDLKAAGFKVQAKIARASADAEVTRKKNAAEAAGFLVSQKAFGSGAGLARYELLKRLAPSIQYIMGNTQGEFAKMFQEIFRGAAIKGGK